MILLLENFRRINRDMALKLLREELEKLGKDLSVNLTNLGIDKHGWGYVELSGSDSDVLTEIIRRKFGIATTDLAKLERGDVVRGVVANSTVGYGIYVDICLGSSNQTDALYPLHAMRSQLADGIKVSARQICRRYCLQEDIPIEIRVNHVDVVSRKVDVELSDRQVSYFKDWIRFPFDRVVLIGCSRDAVEQAVDLTGLRRDIAAIESISLTVHVLICKLGTDAPGVIPRMGPHLRGVSAQAFQPRTHLTEPAQ